MPIKSIVSNLVRFVIAVAVLGITAAPARAFTHPCIPTTLEELDTIKANLNREPWKSGYAQLAAYSTSQLTWQMAGPFENVSRAGNYDAYLGPWQNSMNAVYNLARMWYFTGNEAYAQKAHDILLAWATTHKSFSGNEAGLALGDHAVAFGGGASILRGTWPGWTAADTATVQNYFANVLWRSSAGWNTQGPANKGAIYMKAGIAIALFCDNDPSKFNHIINHMRTFHGAGLMDTLPTGQMGETGRDPGHCWGHLDGLTFVAECAWKQGVDLYGELDNRLLACGEYYARNGFTTDNPYVYFGTIDWQWISNKSWPSVTDSSGWFMLKNAYANRKGLPTPWIDRKMQQQHVDGGSFMFAKTADFTTATLTPATFPAVSPASSGLTLTTLGSQTSGRSASYSNGVWTMSGLGNGTWSDTSDDCQFAYTQMTGDCAMVAKITSNQYPSAQARAGLMIRDNLTATVGQRAWIGALSAPTMKMESHMRGWTENWGGGGYDDRSHDWPPGLPYWIKIERRDKQISTFASPDGTSWSPLNCTYYGNLPSTLYIGLFVSSGTTTTNTATFENVAFTGGTGGLVTTPAAPVGLIAAASDKAVTVRWLASFGATGYDLLRTTTSGSGYAVIASNLTTTSYVDTTVSAGTSYYYVVRAKNSAGTSGNSPEFAASHSQLVPQMANLAFGGTTLASINTGPQVGGSDTAFDGNPASKWFGWNSPTGWLQYDFGAGNAQVVKRYTINSADVTARDPKDWQFQGSQDGSNWTTLDTQIGQTFAINMGMNNYNIANTTAYRYYRINITANNGDTGVAISELGLWGDTGRTIRDGTYRLVSRKSNKIIDLASSGTADGTDAVQWGWNGGDSQKWTLTHLGNGQYQAVGVASGKLLEVTGASTSDGAAVQILTSNNGNGQKWTITPAGDGAFKLLNVNSGKAVDVSGGSTANGAAIIQWPYSGTDNQRWMFSIGVTPQPIPSVPAGLAATAASIQQINLTWTASPGAFHYNVKRATVSGGPYTTVAYDVNTTSYSDTFLTAATTYYYVVSAVNGSGESANSAQASATTLAGPPAAPAGLTTLLGTNQVILNWTATGGATSYTVKRATAPGGPYTTLASGLTSPTYTDTSRTSDVAYYYVVVAVNAFGSGPDSAEATVNPGTLCLHLKFDETGGTIAADSSGFANDATLVNGPNFAAGMLDNALHFPATSSQYARLPSGILSGLTDFTISTWIKVSGTTARTRIFDFGTGANNYMELCPRNDSGFLQYEILAGGTVQKINTTYTFPTGVWTHVALRQSGSTGTLYINGTSVGTNAGLTLKPSNLGTTTLNFLGKSQWGNDPYLNGALDDFRIYAHAMSPAEITALTQPPAGAPRQLAAVPGDAQATLSWSPNATTTYTVKRSTTSGGPYSTIADGVTSTTYTDTGLTNGVTYYYVIGGANSGGPGPDSAEVAVTPGAMELHLKFDEISGSTATDSSGNNRHGTTFNSPDWTLGRIGNSLNFNGTNQYVTLPSGVVSNLNDFTIATWVYWNGGNNWQRIFDFGSGTSTYMFLSPKNGVNGRLRFAIIKSGGGGEQIIDSNAELPTGGWTHVAITLSGSTGTLYVNGQQVGQNSAMTLRPSDLGATTQNRIGRSQFNDPYFNGSIDDFRLYPSALGASGIASLATPMQTTDLTATGGTGQITLAWSATMNATSYTVRRASVSGGVYTTVASGLTDASHTDTDLADGTTYYYVVTPVNASGDGANSAEVSATTLPAAPEDVTATVENGQVLISWSASATAETYNLLRATNISGPYTLLASDIIGTSHTDTTVAPGGTYHYTVTAVSGSGESENSEIATVTMPTLAVCWLKLDETSGTTAADATGNNNSGTLVNSPSWTGGRIGNALNFDGTNPYVTLPNGVTSNLQDFTVATWVYWNGGGNWQRIFDFGSGTSTYMFLSPKNGANNNLRFAITTNGGGGEQKIDSTATLPSGGWHHVAVTLSGSTGTLYVDGQQVGQNTGMTLRPANLGVTTQNRIGRSQYNDPYFNGRIDDFRLYAGALSASDIAALAAPIQTTGLTATGGSGQIALTWDATPNATSYTVRQSSTSGAAYTTVASGLTATSHTDTGLAHGATYHYVVTPANASGYGANSDEASGTALTPHESWRLTHFGTTSNTGDAADNADPDGDGMTNAQEFTAGTDPRDAASVFRVSAVTVSGNDVLLSFPTVAGKTYRLERSDSLLDGSWTPIQDNIPGTGGTIQLTDPADPLQTKRFYRIVVVP